MSKVYVVVTNEVIDDGEIVNEQVSVFDTLKKAQEVLKRFKKEAKDFCKSHHYVLKGDEPGQEDADYIYQEEKGLFFEWYKNGFYCYDHSSCTIHTEEIQ